MMSVGSKDGQVYVLQLSPGLTEMAANEKSGINAMFEREALREKNLDKFQKEAKIRARREAGREKVGCTHEERAWTAVDLIKGGFAIAPFLSFGASPSDWVAQQLAFATPAGRMFASEDVLHTVSLQPVYLMSHLHSMSACGVLRCWPAL